MTKYLKNIIIITNYNLTYKKGAVHMKKAVAFLLTLALVFSFAACDSGNTDTESTVAPTFSADNVNSYVGQAEKEILRTLAIANANFVADVFIKSHLPANQDEALVINGAKYAPVNEKSEIKSYSELLEMLNSVYTAETVKSMIGNPPIYLEHEGRFYYNIDYTSGYFTGEKVYPYSWDNIEIEISIRTSDSISFLVNTTDTYGTPTVFPMVAVNENGNWKLSEFYTVNK